MEHFCVKFGDPSCIGFVRHCAAKQTNEGKNPTPPIGVGKYMHTHASSDTQLMLWNAPIQKCMTAENLVHVNQPCFSLYFCICSAILHSHFSLTA